MEIKDSKSLMENLCQVDTEFENLEKSDDMTGHTRYFKMSSLLANICLLIEQLEQAGAEKTDIKEAIYKTRKAVGKSEYVNRIQTWPRGYQGDYQTVELINVGLKSSSLSSIEECAEYYAQTLPITQQHRNKLMHQERLTRSVIHANGNLLSIGCGGAIDVYHSLQQCGDEYSGSMSFIDMDVEAIELTKQRMNRPDFSFSTKNVLRDVGRYENEHFDLVLCGGIFDYFNEKAAKILLNQISKILKKGGKLFLTNIASGNPFRIVMEYVCDWDLVERDESDVLKMLTDSKYNMDTLDIKRDQTSLALLVEINK